MKWILRLFGLLVLIAVAALVYVYLNLGALVKQGIEQYAPDIVEVPVHVDAVTLMPLSGKGSIQGFTIANPKGYAGDTAVGLGKLELVVDIASLDSDTIVINKILIDTPELNFIQRDNGSSNLQALIDNISRNTASDSSDSSDSAPSKSGNDEAGEASDIKFIIDDFTLRNVIISATSPLLPDQHFKVPMPDLHFNALGRSSGGAPPAEIAKEVTETLLAEAKKALLNSDLYKQQVKAALDKKLAEEKAKLKQRVEEEKQQLEADARRKLDEKLGDNKDLLKGLFK